MKILIIEDSKTARLLLRSSILSQYKPEIEEAFDGREGVEKFRTFKPDLTFLDLTMPVMDGFEALKIIHEEFPKAVIVVLSADIQKKSIQRALDGGAWRFLKKPPQKNEIQKTLEDFLKTAESEA